MQIKVQKFEAKVCSLIGVIYSSDMKVGLKKKTLKLHGRGSRGLLKGPGGVQGQSPWKLQGFVHLKACRNQFQKGNFMSKTTMENKKKIRKYIQCTCLITKLHSKIIFIPTIILYEPAVAVCEG